MSKRRRLILGVLISFGLVGFALLARWRSREPVFEGKPISYWLDATQRQLPSSWIAEGSRRPSNPFVKAKDAVASIGPEALPYIAARAGGEPASPWRRLYGRAYQAAPQVVRTYLPEPATGRGLGMLTTGYFLAVTERAGTNAIPVLIDLYSSKNAHVRRAVVLSLGRLDSSDHARTVPLLQRALLEDSLPIRFDAFRILCQMAGTDARAGAILADYLNTAGTNAPDWMRLEGMAAVAAATGVESRANAGRPPLAAMNAWEKAFLAVAEWQRTPTPEQREQVLMAFEAAFATNTETLGPSVRRAFEMRFPTARQEEELLVPVLIKGLISRNLRVRTISAEMLGELGSAVRASAPSVLQAFAQHPSYEFCYLLAHLGPRAAPAVATLVRELNSATNTYPIFEVTTALGSIGREASNAIPTLLRIVKEQTGDARGYALAAVAQIQPQHPDLVPLLLTELKAEDWGDRCRAANILGGMGPLASNTLPALKQMVTEDPWLGPRLDSATAILRIDKRQGEELVPVLIEALEWPDGDGWPTPVIVARLLAQAGDAARPAIPGLLKLFDHEDERARIAAAEALAKLDPSRRASSVAVLRELMKQPHNGNIRFYAATTLLALSPESAAEVAAEVGDLFKPNIEFYRQVEAIQFLSQLGASARVAVPQLQMLLETGDWKTRRAARDAIQEIGATGGDEKRL
jgi:HEAT repeat protein